MKKAVKLTQKENEEFARKTYSSLSKGVSITPPEYGINMILPKSKQTIIRYGNIVLEKKGGEKNRNAIKKNNQLIHDNRSITLIQKVLNVPLSGIFDSQTIEAIGKYQIKEKVLSTLKESESGILNFDTIIKLYWKMYEGDERSEIIYLMVDYFLWNKYFLYKKDIQKIIYKKEIETGANARIIFNDSGNYEIEIAENAFRYPAFLIRTIAHEIEHVRQGVERRQIKAKGKKILLAIGVDEFLAESLDIINENLPPKLFLDILDDASRVMNEWNKIQWQKINQKDQKVLIMTFLRVRKKIISDASNFKGLFVKSPYNEFSHLINKYKEMDEAYLKTGIEQLIKNPKQPWE